MIPILLPSNCRALRGAVLATLFAGGLCAQTVWYVNANAPASGTGTSWSAPFDNLQDAFTVAQPGDQIWVAAGTYYPSLPTNPADPRSATFSLPHDVAIYGGFRGYEASVAAREQLFDRTVLSGDIGTPSSYLDNCYHVVTLGGTTHYVTTVLDGFTVRYGYGLSGPGSPSRGAGITVHMGPGTHTPTLILRNSRVRDNFADQGAGIAVTNLGSVRMSKCRVIENGAEDVGGGAYVQTAWLWSASNEWAGNVAVNRGGALFTTSTSSSMVRLANDTFFGNSADQGGAIYVAGSQFIHGNVTAVNCTFGCNFANAGVSIYANTAAQQPAELTVHNSILWHEPPGGPPTLVGSGSTVTVSYSCVLGGFAGTGNINIDPLFLDCAGGNLRLAAASPCNDAGNSNLLPEDYGDVDGDGNFAEPLPLDADGGRRVTDDPSAPNTGVGNPPVDMGAYEY